jgi:hypothetical protein
MMVLITGVTPAYVIMVASGRSVASPERRGLDGRDRA